MKKSFVFIVLFNIMCQSYATKFDQLFIKSLTIVITKIYNELNSSDSSDCSLDSDENDYDIITLNKLLTLYNAKKSDERKNDDTTFFIAKSIHAGTIVNFFSKKVDDYINNIEIDFFSEEKYLKQYSNFL